MKAIVLLSIIGLSACANSPLYPGLSFGTCGVGETGRHTVYDFLGVPECVPNASSAERHSSRWID